VAGPGFLNITLAADALGEVARIIVESGPAFGRGEEFAGQKLNLEFVSANPTGPVHLGAVRWAAVGDALARLLQASGADVTREYYFNDAGSQIERFARTLREVANGRPVPDDGYAGSYIDEIAAAVVAQHPDLLSRPEAEQTEIFRRDGVELMFAEIRASLTSFGVEFDVYFNERDLHDRGELDHAL
jgi:arginyl-tRNA synthetase